jgi:hypothetical protein
MRIKKEEPALSSQWEHQPLHPVERMLLKEEMRNPKHGKSTPQGSIQNKFYMQGSLPANADNKKFPLSLDGRGLR